MQPYTKVPRVALVAVASNESAYVAEWVHHHLYFGFDPIDVVVNRSDDGTEALLRRIAAHEPRLRVWNGDHFDTARGPSPIIQLQAYAERRRALRAEFSRDDYVLYLDIDEFWTPSDFSATPSQLLAATGRPALAAFNWFAMASDTAPFAPSFEVEIEGVHHPLVKTAHRLGVRVLKQNAHAVFPFPPARPHLASGGVMTLRNPARAASAPDGFGTAFVLHRLYRSAPEYLSILGRRRPRKPDAPFKDNRKGYQASVSSNRALRRFSVEPARLADYRESHARFLDRTGAGAALPAARQKVLDCAGEVLERYAGMAAEERRHWEQQFSRLDLNALAEELPRLRARFGPGAG